jgi:hypothetical protein
MKVRLASKTIEPVVLFHKGPRTERIKLTCHNGVIPYKHANELGRYLIDWLNEQWNRRAAGEEE